MWNGQLEIISLQNGFTTTGQGAFSAWNRMLMQSLFQGMVS
jgi:hypothetical protein